VDEDGVGAVEPAVVLDVGEQRQVAGGGVGGAVGVGVLGGVAGDPVEDELADGGVVTDDDEDGGGAALGGGGGVGPPVAEGALVVRIQAVQGAFDLGGELRGAGLLLLLGTSATGQRVADLGPEVAVHGMLADHRVVGDGYAGDLDEA